MDQDRFICSIFYKNQGDCGRNWSLDLFEEQGRPYTEPAIVVGGKVVVPPFERVERARSVTIPSRGGGVGGIAVTVGVDGWYPVYLERNKAGEMLRLIIELGGQVKP
jgi:hypothetical protein